MFKLLVILIIVIIIMINITIKYKRNKLYNQLITINGWEVISKPKDDYWRSSTDVITVYNPELKIKTTMDYNKWYEIQKIKTINDKYGIVDMREKSNSNHQ